MLNGGQPPFDNLTARQAMAYATDQAGLHRRRRPGQHPAACTPCSARARRTTPTRPTRRSTSTRPRSWCSSTSRRRASRWQFTLRRDSTDPARCRPSSSRRTGRRPGMKVDIKLEEQATLIVDAVTGKYQATTWGQFGSPDPDYDYLWWISDNAAPMGQLGLNIARNKDPRDRRGAARRPGPPPTWPSGRRTTPPSPTGSTRTCPTSGWPAATTSSWPTNEVRGITQGPLPDGQPSYPHGWSRWLRHRHPPHPDLARPLAEPELARRRDRPLGSSAVAPVQAGG